MRWDFVEDWFMIRDMTDGQAGSVLDLSAKSWRKLLQIDLYKVSRGTVLKWDQKGNQNESRETGQEKEDDQGRNWSKS